MKFKELKEETLIRLDLGAGKNAADGFIGIDIRPSKGIKTVDIRKRWPWKSNSVDEARAANLIQYFNAEERAHFVNELYRVLKPDCKAQIITPYWAASKAYGDPTVAWPAVSEAWYQMLAKPYRDALTWIETGGYRCNFDVTLGYGLHPSMIGRVQDYQQHWVTFGKEAAQDLIATLTKR